MPVPQFSEFFSPVFQQFQDGRTYTIPELQKLVVQGMRLSQEDEQEMVPNGTTSRVRNRLSWTLTYLRKAGLIVSPVRGKNVITDRGREAYREFGNAINFGILDRYKEFREFHRSTAPEPTPAPPLTETPEEQLCNAFTQINKNLEDNLLEKVLEQSSAFFEKLVVDLLIKMGYGGAFEDAGLVVGRNGDEGIDGIIREDKLGFNNIYIQAKKWALTRSVGRPDIQGFVGALAGRGATKGLFITTSKFSNDATTYAQNSTVKSAIVLVDGKMLVKLMIEYSIGVSTQSIYEIKKIDTDFFIEGD